MWVYWLAYVLLLPLVPFVIAAVAASASLQMSKRRWFVHSLALLLIVLTLPIYCGVGLILDPSIGDTDEGVGFAVGVGTLLNIFTGSVTLIGYAIFAVGYAIFAWCTRRQPRALTPAN